ncbi:phage tail protein [Kribbella monticola]|uniref:phage tail protein n=1 Tax=Kribbella monticola TaxID=2185285 RepID=UPI000DD41199|nr:phage tail protein [Kribbella monticola]
MTTIGFQQLANPVQALRSGDTGARNVHATDPQYGMTMWFSVLVPGLDSVSTSLGYWSGCSGLGVELTPEGPVAEGGNHGTQRYLPGEIKYTKVTLERAMTAEGSAKVQRWLEAQVAGWAQGWPAGPQRPVVIELRSGLGRQDRVIHKWVLNDAIPTSWTVPPFSTGSGGGIAIEKLTFVHSGFLKAAEPVPGSQLELHEWGNRTDRLTFFANPSKIGIEKSRVADTKRASVDSHTVVVDPNALKVELPELRLEGCEAIARAVPLLKKWLQLKPSSAASAGKAPAAPDDDPKDCDLCNRKLPSASDGKAAGSPWVLALGWGQAGIALPGAVLLKQFNLQYTRFTPAGEPSRATVKLTLQECEQKTLVGAHREKSVHR